MELVPIIVFLSILLIIVLFAISIMCVIYHSAFYRKSLTRSLYGTATHLPRVGNPGSVRIAVFMVATPEIESYSEYTGKQNQKWCKMHGYDFFMYDRKHPKLEDLPINFSKIQYTLDLLPQYDYVMYIDADAIVHNMDYDIRHLIKYYGRSVLFGEDCYSSKDCSKPGRINSGVFIVRNNWGGRYVMNKWLESTRGRCSRYVTIFPNCQLIFTNCVYPQCFPWIGIIPFNLMNGFGDTLLIKHAMALDDIRRVGEVKKLYRSEDRVRVF